MSGIHNLILNKLQSELTLNLITNIDAADIARAGIVKIGPLQGDPDPDVARISVELYYNDPEQTIKGSGFSKVANEWDDIVDEIEVGGSITWRRRFTLMNMCQEACFLNTCVVKSLKQEARPMLTTFTSKFVLKF